MAAARVLSALLRAFVVVGIGLLCYLMVVQSSNRQSPLTSSSADTAAATTSTLDDLGSIGRALTDTRSRSSSSSSNSNSNVASKPSSLLKAKHSPLSDDVDVSGRASWSAPKDTETTTVRLLQDFSVSGDNTPIRFIREYCDNLAPEPLKDFARPWKIQPMIWGATGEQTICIRGRTLLTDYRHNRTQPKPTTASDSDDDDDDSTPKTTVVAALPKKLKPSQKRIIRHLLQSAPRGPLAPWMLKRYPVYLQDLSSPSAFPSLLRGRRPAGSTTNPLSQEGEAVPAPPSAPDQVDPSTTSSPTAATASSSTAKTPEEMDGGGGAGEKGDSAPADLDNTAAMPSNKLTHESTVSQSTKHKYLVMHRGVGLIAATYLHGFHVLVNTMLPLVNTMLTKYTGNSRTPNFTRMDHGADGVEGKPHSVSPPLFDFTILRHPYFGEELVGGERLSYEFATPLATEGPPRILHRADGVEDESVTHCYCAAVLHDMVAAEFMTSLPETRRIAWGDPLRRRSTLYVKESLNRRYGFLPYGTYPIPPAEYAAYGLWTNPEIPTTTPRLLLLLRNKTRILGDADLVAHMASSAGFNVQSLTPEHEPIALQARAARYADVMLAVHGQALTWSIMMDGTKATHCREVLELQFFGRGLRGMQNVFEVIAADSYLRYYRTPPKEMDFLNATCPDGCRSWRKAMKMARYPQTMKGFSMQRVWFSGNRELQGLLPEMYRRVSKCVVKNVPVEMPEAYFERSDRSKPNYYKF